MQGTRYFWALAALTTFVAAASATNIVVNGSFEDTPLLPYNGGGVQWGVFSSIPGWQLSYGPAIEVMRSKPGGWLAAHGQQWLELDADTIPPTHTQGQIGVYQDLNTVSGAWYTLRFAFSPRPGWHPSGPELDGIRVYWDGNLIATVMGNGTSLTNTSWTYYTFTVKATSNLTRLEFQDASEFNNTYGAFLDDVSVELVPEPASFTALVAGIVALQRRRRCRARN